MSLCITVSMTVLKYHHKMHCPHHSYYQCYSRQECKQSRTLKAGDDKEVKEGYGFLDCSSWLTQLLFKCCCWTNKLNSVQSFHNILTFLYNHYLICHRVIHSTLYQSSLYYLPGVINSFGTESMPYSFLHSLQYLLIIFNTYLIILICIDQLFISYLYLESYNNKFNRQHLHL